MTLVKHSKRTLRSGCDYCKSTDVYWAHDLANVKGAAHCKDCNVLGRFVLIGRAGNRHVCSGSDVKDDRVAVTPDEFRGSTPDVVKDAVTVDSPDSTPIPAITPPTTSGGSAKWDNPAPKDEVTTAPAPDAFAAFQTLMGAMSPKVDRDEVMAMIRTALDEVTFPTRTVVERKDGTTKPVEGSTHPKMADVATDLLGGEHVLMVGPAGTGKSTIAEQSAEALGIPYYAISLSPMTPASQILGYMQAEGEYVRSLFREAYEGGGVFHFDEFDNGHPSVLAVINAALANGMMAFPDGMVKRHDDFRCVASANTYGRGADRAYVGRQQLDAATLDRFTVETIEVDEALESDLCHATGLESDRVKRVLTLVRKLRKNAADKRMTVVISPRASVGMCRLLAAGRTWDDAIEGRVRRGMSDADWAKLND